MEAEEELRRKSRIFKWHCTSLVAPLVHSHLAFMHTAKAAIMTKTTSLMLFFYFFSFTSFLRLMRLVSIKRL